MTSIVSYFPINKGAMVANFAIKFDKMGGLVIRDCILFEKDGKSWVSQYIPNLGFEDKEMNEQFKEKIRQTIKDYLQKIN